MTEEYDVLIVGGGIVGISISYFLKTFQPDCKVLVIEKSTIGSGATGLSAGTLWCMGYGDYNDAEACVTQSTTDFLNRLYEKGFDFEYVQSGALTLVFTEQQANHYIENTKKLISRGFNLKYISNPKEIEPGLDTSVIGAVLTPLSSHVQPMQLAITIGEAAEQLGVQILENNTVLKIARDNTNNNNNTCSNYHYNVTVTSHDSSSSSSSDMKKNIVLKARKVVLAAGVNTNFFLQQIFKDTKYLHSESFWETFSVVPVKGSIWLTEVAPLQTLKHVIFNGASHFTWHHTRNGNTKNIKMQYPYCLTHVDGKRITFHSYGRQNKDGSILFGGGRTKANNVNDYELNLNHLNENRKYVYNFLPTLENIPIQGNWTGVMPFSMSGYPILKQFSQYDGHTNLYIASGFGPEGIMQGPGAAKAFAAYILNKKEKFYEHQDKIRRMLKEEWSFGGC